MFTGISSGEKLAGIFGLSSYLLLHDKIKDYVTSESANKDTPVFMGHGDVDPLVKHEWGSETAKVLKEMGWTVDFRTYKGVFSMPFTSGESRSTQFFPLLLSMYPSSPMFNEEVSLTACVTTGLAHSADLKEMDDLEKYLAERLPPQT